MIYVTGDTHGNFEGVYLWASLHHGDELIILGDAGINYYGGSVDKITKERLNSCGIRIICIHGNHEERPQNIDTYVYGEYRGGQIMYEEEYPNILFAVDGEIYDFDGMQAIVIGGAYSIDKDIRLLKGYKWFPDEQPSQEVKEKVEKKLDSVNWSIDIVLSHTCPTEFEPTDMFLDGFDQSLVDKSTEMWLQTIKDKLKFKKWYFGHFHGDRERGNGVYKYRMMFKDIDELSIK